MPVSIVCHAENAGFIGSPWISNCPARLAAGSPLRGKHSSPLQPYPCREDRGAFLRDLLGAFRAVAEVQQPDRALPATVLRLRNHRAPDPSGKTIHHVPPTGSFVLLLRHPVCRHPLGVEGLAVITSCVAGPGGGRTAAIGKTAGGERVCQYGVIAVV